MEKEFKKEEAKNILQMSGMQTARPVPLLPTNSHSMWLVIGRQQLSRSTM